MKGSEGREISGWAGTLAGAALICGLLPALMGCNSVTGVSDLEIVGKTSSAASGAGGGSGTGNGAGGGSTSNGGGKLCTYPMGQWTHAVGGTIPESLNWQGMVEMSNTQATISIADYLDCDGSKNINAILIDTSATWCPACQDEAKDLPSKMATWGPMGIKVLTLMIEDNPSPTQATYQTAVNWKNDYGLDAVAIAADPGFSFAPAGEQSVGLPLQTIVDPRTMQIVNKDEGYAPGGPIEGELTALAQKNKGQ